MAHASSNLAIQGHSIFEDAKRPLCGSPVKKSLQDRWTMYKLLHQDTSSLVYYCLRLQQTVAVNISHLKKAMVRYAASFDNAVLLPRRVSIMHGVMDRCTACSHC